MLFTHTIIVSLRHHISSLHLITCTYNPIVLISCVVGCFFHLVLLKAVFYSLQFSIRMLFILILLFVYYFHWYTFYSNNFDSHTFLPLISEADPEILKRKGGFYVGHHVWPTKKILDFRWSKKAEITLETVSFWQNISVCIFKFSPFLSIKSYQFF